MMTPRAWKLMNLVKMQLQPLYFEKQRGLGHLIDFSVIKVETLASFRMFAPKTSSQL